MFFFQCFVSDWFKVQYFIHYQFDVCWCVCVSFLCNFSFYDSILSPLYFIVNVVHGTWQLYSHDVLFYMKKVKNFAIFICFFFFLVSPTQMYTRGKKLIFIIFTTIFYFLSLVSTLTTKVERRKCKIFINDMKNESIFYLFNVLFK